MKSGYFFQILFGMDIWRSIGWDSIIYLAAISAVDQEQYEAAEMDGCNRLRQIWHVTLPGIRGTIGLLFIMGVGGLLSSGFDQIYLLRTPGNMTVADTLDVYVVRIGLQNGQFGYASAIGLIQGWWAWCWWSQPTPSAKNTRKSGSGEPSLHRRILGRYSLWNGGRKDELREDQARVDGANRSGTAVSAPVALADSAAQPDSWIADRTIVVQAYVDDIGYTLPKDLASTPVMQKIKELTGISLEIRYTPGDSDSAVLASQLAAGNIPDVVISYLDNSTRKEFPILLKAAKRACSRTCPST
jgi:hypothetical protein